MSADPVWFYWLSGLVAIGLLVYLLGCLFRAETMK